MLIGNIRNLVATYENCGHKNHVCIHTFVVISDHVIISYNVALEEIDHM